MFLQILLQSLTDSHFGSLVHLKLIKNLYIKQKIKTYFFFFTLSLTFSHFAILTFLISYLHPFFVSFTPFNLQPPAQYILHIIYPWLNRFCNLLCLSGWSLDTTVIPGPSWVSPRLRHPCQCCPLSPPGRSGSCHPPAHRRSFWKWNKFNCYSNIFIIYLTIKKEITREENNNLIWKSIYLRQCLA